MGKAFNGFYNGGFFLVMKRGPKPRDWKERFWEKVDQRGVDDCWPWKAGCSGGGYGWFTLPDAKQTVAHRVAFFLTHGRWPEPQALHSCDNPPCCNPRHLFEGTQTDNMRDASQKGRMRTGEGHPNSKLTWDKVDRMRKQREEAGTSATKLAITYGICDTVVKDVLNERTWKPETRPPGH